MKVHWLIVALLVVPLAQAGIDVSHKCEHPACLEGTDINFTVVINNNLKDNIVIDDITIEDLESGQILAVDAGKAAIVLKEETKEFLVLSTVRAPIRGYTFYYVPCFQAKAFDGEQVTAQGEICGQNIRSLTVIPLSKVECRTDAECNETDYCNTHSLYQCRPLDCLDNQTIDTHRCVDLSCGSLQYPQGHRCTVNTAALLGLTLLVLIVVALGFALFGRRKPRKR